MTDKVYSCAYRLEHYTGWNGTGTPIYNKIDTTYLDSNNLNSIAMVGVQQTDTVNSQICWQDVTLDSSDTIWVSYEISNQQTGYGTWGGHIFSLLDKTTNLSLSYYFSRNSNGTIALNILNSTYDSTNHIKLGSTLGTVSSLVLGNYDNAPLNMNIKITRSTGAFSIYAKNVSAGMATTLLYSGTSTNIKSLSSTISLLIGCTGSTSTSDITASLLYYSYVTNFDTRNTYLDYSLMSGYGTYKDWSGTFTSFSNYPLDTLSLTSGVISSSTNQNVTFSKSKTFSQNTTMPWVRALCLSNSAISNGDNEISNIFYDGANITDDTNYSIPTTGNTQIKIYTTNPVNNQSFTFNNLNSYEYGLTRIS